ncbi:hypothetical protein BGZ57DRAFT_862471 [Hyaloscypha finlandica]|nr:hypothetical protein BGZ57DRAFT_862471 [Hyaloscypha finlandica]
MSSIPLLPVHDEILLAQEAAEDQRLQARAQEVWHASQEYSCPEDNETTPWLKQTQWPSFYWNKGQRGYDVTPQNWHVHTRGLCQKHWGYVETPDLVRARVGDAREPPRVMS